MSNGFRIEDSGAPLLSIERTNAIQADEIGQSAEAMRILQH
jgi:hypothetical protein